MTETKRGPHDFQVGDTVQLTGQFLKNTGQRAGGEGQKTWKVLHVDLPKSQHDFTMIVVNEPKGPEDLQYFTAEELETVPWLKWRRINAKNLKRVGVPSIRDVY